MKGMADSLRDLGELVLDRTLVLNLLCGLSRHYDYLKALIKRSVSFPSFHDVRNELLLEELTMDAESPTSATMLYNASFASHAHSHFDDRGEGGGLRALLPPPLPLELFARLPASTAVVGPARASMGRWPSPW
jgi:hypothetical protein